MSEQAPAADAAARHRIRHSLDESLLAVGTQ